MDHVRARLLELGELIHFVQQNEQRVEILWVLRKEQAFCLSQLEPEGDRVLNSWQEHLLKHPRGWTTCSLILGFLSLGVQLSALGRLLFHPAEVVACLQLLAVGMLLLSGSVGIQEGMGKTEKGLTWVLLLTGALLVLLPWLF